jgi:hypothetical protein
MLRSQEALAVHQGAAEVARHAHQHRQPQDRPSHARSASPRVAPDSHATGGASTPAAVPSRWCHRSNCSGCRPCSRRAPSPSAAKLHPRASAIGRNAPRAMAFSAHARRSATPRAPAAAARSESEREDGTRIQAPIRRARTRLVGSAWTGRRARSRPPTMPGARLDPLLMSVFWSVSGPALASWAASRRR